MKVVAKASAPEIPLALALRIGRDLCEARNVTLVLPGDPYRTAIVYLLAGFYALASAVLGRPVGWELEAVRQGLSITLPGAGRALDLVKLIPTVGPALAGWLAGERQTQVAMSPAACTHGGSFLATLVHELLHAEKIDAGGLPWCLLVLVDKETMAGNEGPSYGQTLLALVYLCGYTPDEAREACVASLGGYDLDQKARELAEDIIDVSYRTALRGGLTEGALLDAIRGLTAAGVQGLPAIPAPV